MSTWTGMRFKQDSGGLLTGERAKLAPASRSSATCRSSGVVTLRFSSLALTTITLPPRRSISHASSVARASSSVGNVQSPLERRAAEHLRRLHGPQLAAVERLAHRARAVHRA